MYNRDRVPNKTSYERRRRAQMRRAEKLRAEMKSKSRTITKEASERARISPSFHAIRPYPFRVVRPIPGRASGFQAHSHQSNRAPDVQIPLAHTSTMPTHPNPFERVRGSPDSMASFYTDRTAVARPPVLQAQPPPAPLAMSVCSTSNMDVADDDGVGMHTGQGMPLFWNSLPTPPLNTVPSPMGARTVSAMEVEDDGATVRTAMSDITVAMPYVGVLPQGAGLHIGDRCLLPVEERYNILMNFVQQLYHNMNDEFIQIAMGNGLPY